MPRLHSHSEMGLEAADPLRPKLRRQVQFAGDFGDLKAKPRISKLSQEKFLGTFKIVGEGEEVAG